MSKEHNWSEADDAIIRAGYRNGTRCRQIAKKIGGVRRDAVIGRAHRLGLTHSSPRIARNPNQHPKPIPILDKGVR